MRQIALLLFCVSLFANESFTVTLDTESQLQPVTLHSHVSADLTKVMEWDINHSGLMTLSEAKTSRATIELFSSKEQVWATVKSRAISKKSDSLPLSRASIHRLHDWATKTLFGIDGVASTKILYTVRQGEIAEVWECDWDGANARQVTKEGKLIVTPSYFPAAAGKRPGAFVYVSYSQGQPKMYIASLDNGKASRLSTLRGNQLMPVVSPDRSSIAFVSDAMGNPDLFILPYNPSTAQALLPRQIFASPKGTQGSPAFSPDSGKIAFVSNKDGAPRIFMMEVPPPGVKLRDINPKLVSKSCRENTAPTWSPDGRYIAYSGIVKGVRQIWVYDTLEKREEQLTSGGASKENASWASDSLHLVFNSDGELYIVDLTSRQPTRITKGAGDKRFPSWEIIRH